MQQISVIALGVRDLTRSKRFYVEGFGRRPVFENDEIVFYQMNGLMLGTWLEAKLQVDAGRAAFKRPGAFALAHNVPTREDVAPLMQRLTQFGGTLLRQPEAPPHGGFGGYLTDPDDHAWEIAFNPAWRIDAEGHVHFGL